ncbi:MAG: polysaccharide biosynthesis/export family protein, partial [Limisphaerales bacterium]
MNFVSKLALFLCAALLSATVLTGCGSTSQPFLSDNPTPPSASGMGSALGAPVGSAASNGVSPTAGASGTGMSTGAAAPLASGAGNATDDPGSIPAGAPRFQSGETVNISSSTGSELVQGPIPTTPQSYLIADDGTISLPYIGSVQAAGKTPGELQRIITKLYVPQYYV